MANTLYPKGREAFATGQIDWVGDDIRLVLLDASYVYSDAHDFRSDIAGGAVVEESDLLTGKSATDGICDAADIIVTTVSGDTITQIAVFKDTGVDATSPLLLFYDATASSVLINLIPDGTGVRIRWSNGPLKVFRL